MNSTNSMSTSNFTDLTTTFRDAMATVCAPVSVVTAMDGERPHGTTVSAFASLSMTPPMVLVSLDNGSDLLRLVRTTGRFGLNVLGTAQAAHALAFARKGEDKFNGIAWSQRHGVPRIDDVLCWVSCELAELVPAGDHFVALGNVVAAEVSGGEPLTYYLRTFGTHAEIQV
ncbi:flavin reductase family protein [Streptomyces sp. NPDC057474]|uniref:flavin reductase family protein n=1 Tax=Streptomyces sp. NPDC057474 TaxID=3346144 RepID=UPI0036A71533